ncbi:MAG: YihY/virulence factor BrkB family protein [Muribaculaceae bacterium]|nr:YihY/virulence factor BrkB family protein [Muribaculaceae bacterium]
MGKNTDSAPSGNVKEKKEGFFTRIYNKVYAFVMYCISGVWQDPRQTFKVRLIKTLNLSVNSFLDRGLQIRSMALTYYTVLSLVPALALLVAIGRGFGMSDSMQTELYTLFPSQHKVISTAMQFVDSYLNEASQGVFVGVGLVMLLWTIISLLSYIEDAFNSIWDVKEGRTLYQKITDYIAICLIIPVLILCSSGVSIFMSSTVRDSFNLPFLNLGVNIALETAPLILAWMAFTFSYYFIPTTKVNFKYAMISGTIAAISFHILQLLFVNGQIYVSKYNAIYGSFAFLPLMLVWLQLSWMIMLAGCVITYSLQNVFSFNFLGNVEDVSNRSWRYMALITMCVIVKRFITNKAPLSVQEIAAMYNLPVRLVNRVTEKLLKAKLVYVVKLDETKTGLSPAMEVSALTLGHFFQEYDVAGANDIIPDFDKIYADLIDLVHPLAVKSYDDYNSLLLKDVPLPTPEQIHQILLKDDITVSN